MSFIADVWQRWRKQRQLSLLVALGTSIPEEVAEIRKLLPEDDLPRAYPLPKMANRRQGMHLPKHGRMKKPR